MTETIKMFTKILGVICYLTTVLYLIELFIPSLTLQIIYSLLAAILLVCAFFFLTTINRVIILILLIIGFICLNYENASFLTAVLGFGENINLLSLFLLIPLIGTFMSTAGYLTALKQFVQKRHRSIGQHPYSFSFALTATIGILLNFGSMAIVKRIIEESFSTYQDKKITLMIMRGFAVSMLWSPYFVNVGLVLVLFNVSWFDISGFGLVLALVYLIISACMFKYISFPDDQIKEQKEYRPENSDFSMSLKPFLLFTVALVGLSFILDIMLTVKMLTIVSLLAIMLPFLWATVTGILTSFVQDVTEQVLNSFTRLKNELAVFISAGFLGLAMSQTEVGTMLSLFLFQSSFGSIYLLSLLLVVLATILAQVGIHPVIIVIGIGSSLTPDLFGVSPEYLALILLVSWTVSTQLSPFSGQVLMASKLMEQSTKVIVKQNIIFVCLLAIILPAILYGFHLIGWL
ncbi:hypothetical protein [Halalkalibacter akibai]|uniref:C4-dicarboxylate ABC transporter n=1 Tax=Halalkalibacter akibai (strain ATCC 43226 / DSM 21942 / CIP 109018 / JCM 9157 / 1139) TaxID=1236973 RepID=W4QVH3_HALA3|nr:hypothetical protein [Halalkalibacter akibai]GAE36145.1 hypothetical protein JCM9157_3294 [Halalkalibacter akibai JCM 9157]